MNKKILFSIVLGLVLMVALPFLVRGAAVPPSADFTTASPGYANNSAPQAVSYVGSANVPIMDVSLPDPVDTVLAGSGAPAPGSAINTTNPWASATVPVYFYDGGTSGVWESASDGIFTDDDKDGVYTPAADTLVDADGGGANATTTGTTSLTPGTPLYKVDAPDHICTNSTTSPTCVWWDGSTSGDCTTTTDAYRLVGNDGCPATTDTLVTTTTAKWSKETSAAYATSTAPDLFIESVPWALTYSAAADTELAGSGVPASGSAIVTTNPWASATIPVFFYDGGTSGVWEPSSDGIFADSDSSGYYNGDKISSIVISNTGNALDSDISAIKVWQEDGTTAGFQANQDTLIGSVSSGAKWGQTISATNPPVYTASSKDRIYVTADISPSAENGRTIKAEIPVNGLQFVSTNDGPSDSAIVNVYTQTIAVGPNAQAFDNIAPTSAIINPQAGAIIKPGVDYVIKGDCSDTGGSSVKQVEISLDGGKTWNLVTPVQLTSSGFTWKYLWQSPLKGSYILKTRATDWVGNIETPSKGVKITVGVSIPTPPPSVKQPPTTTPPVQKPITQMTAQELQAKITEIQAKIIQLLQELINMIRNQISQLQGTV